MSKLISIRDDLYEKLKGETQTNGLSSSAKIDKLYSRIYELEAELKALEETTVTQEGRFIGSKTLAGKAILYKVKEVIE